MHTGDLLSQRAHLTPEREALLEVETGSRYSYAQLNARANQSAHWLRANGLTTGDRVSILAHNSVAYLDLFYACGKIGVILAPLNWRLAAAELAYILHDCRPRLLLVGPEFEDVLTELTAALSAAGVARVARLTEYADELAQQSSGEPTRPADLGPEMIQCILYTSGTTGRPKGALIPQRQVLWNCINTVISWGLTAQDVSPVFTPLFHAGGLFAFLTPLLYVGGRIVLTRSFEAAVALRLIEQEGCTVILGVPTLFQMWLKTPELASADFSQVRFFISGGAPCPIPLMQAWRAQTGAIFRQGYGLSEVGPNCFSMTDAESEPKSGSVGKPIFHSQMRLVDAYGQDTPVGETGELIIRGPHVCAGYLNNPAATAAAIRDGWFYTGDMARRDADGFYYIAGRFKDMLISGGENVYAAEVEAVFLEHPAVQECALIGRPDETWGEVGVMIVVAREMVSAETLLDYSRTRLARYKTPKAVIFTDALPYSPYGKVEKARLRAMWG